MKNLLLLMILFLTAFMYGCGGGLSPKEVAARRIILEIPTGIDKDLFWNGVFEKGLLWEENGTSNVEYFVSGALPASKSLAKGGILSFQGRDSDHHLLVSGSTVVSSNQEQIIIPLQRVF